MKRHFSFPKIFSFLNKSILKNANLAQGESRNSIVRSLLYLCTHRKSNCFHWTQLHSLVLPPNQKEFSPCQQVMNSKCHSFVQILKKIRYHECTLNLIADKISLAFFPVKNILNGKTVFSNSYVLKFCTYAD